MEEDIPVTTRCIYWLLRLIPSRISEILGMKIECLKPFDGHYCLFIPMWKQNGGYKEPIIRTIHIEDKEMGGHLIALIQEQQIMAMSYQCYLKEDKKGALFAYRSQILQKGVWYSENRYSVASWPYISYQLKEICRRYDVRDENGTEYVVTSHQFRHNGVTDRLRAGFTLPQIAEMTAHHGTAMLYASYAHLNLFPETIVEPMKYQTEAENPYVLFGGKILNMDTVTESRLLKNIRAHRVPGGVCTDVTHCRSGIKTQERKKSTKKEKLADIVVEKDKKIQELRALKEELERENIQIITEKTKIDVDLFIKWHIIRLRA